MCQEKNSKKEWLQRIQPHRARNEEFKNGLKRTNVAGFKTFGENQQKEYTIIHQRRIYNKDFAT